MKSNRKAKSNLKGDLLRVKMLNDLREYEVQILNDLREHGVHSVVCKAVRTVVNKF